MPHSIMKHEVASTVAKIILFYLIWNFAIPLVRHFLPDQISQHFTQYVAPHQLSLVHRYFTLACVLVIYVLFLKLDNKSWTKSVFFTAQGYCFGIIRGCLIGIALIACYMLMLIVTGMLIRATQTNQISTIFIILGLWIVAQLANSITEEVVFRGYLLDKTSTLINPHLSIFIIAIVFGFAHIAEYSLTGGLFASALAILLGYVYLFYRNIYATIAIHFIWDVSSHTLLMGKIINFSILKKVVIFGISITNNSYLATASMLLITILFFIYKRLWKTENLLGKKMHQSK